jgi:hypothetical protein
MRVSGRCRFILLTRGAARCGASRARVLSACLAACILLGCDDGPGAEPDEGPFYAQASAEIALFRPRETIDPNLDVARDPSSVTSWWPISGRATFKTTRDGVDVSVLLKNCRAAYGYPINIYEQASCSELTAGTKPWDGERGTIETNALCLGASGARLHHARAHGAQKRWTLGGRSRTNLVGRTIAVLDPDTGEPLACGKIEAAEDAGFARPLDPAALPSDAVLAEVAGLCLLGREGARLDAGVACPDVPKLAECALVHCLASCLDACAEHIACVQAAAPCSGHCVQDPACNACLDGAQCTLGYCRKELSCAPPPTPNGPCTELRACCMRQGPLLSSCLEYASQLEDLSGDMSCRGALSDWDVNTNFTYRSPCYPDGGAPSE